MLAHREFSLSGLGSKLSCVLILVFVVGVPTVGAQTNEAAVRYAEQKKEPWAAVGLEWLVPVVGHAYAGDAKRGLLPAAVSVGGIVVAVAGPKSCETETSAGVVWEYCEAGSGAIIGALVFVGGRIWGMVSASRTANEFNRDLRDRLGIGSMGFAVVPDGRGRVSASVRVGIGSWP